MALRRTARSILVVGRVPEDREVTNIETLIPRVEALQNLLVSYATGGGGDDLEYRVLRDELRADVLVEPLLPRFVKDCRDLRQFWGHIKAKFATYAERRQYLWDSFRPLLEKLDRVPGDPADEVVSETLAAFNTDSVHAIWRRALDRRKTDAEGAITLARTLLEGVCKHVLDELKAPYAEGDDLPKLYRLTAQQLQLAPDQYAEPVFKQILGGCTAVVEGIGAARNRLSDSHGRGKASIKPGPRHAQLVVNLAGAAATFIVETFESRRSGRG